MIRRILLTAGAMVFMLASPAAAGYSDVLGTGQKRNPTVVATQPASKSGQSLARTGSDSIVPLAEAATVLIGGGALLVVAARRRRSQHDVATS